MTSTKGTEDREGKEGREGTGGVAGTKVSQPKAGRPLDEEVSSAFAKASVDKKVSKVSQVWGGTNVAFKPFENSVYDVRGLGQLLEELALIERALFRGREGTISEKSKDFTTGVAVSLFEEIEKTGMEPATDAKQLAFIKSLVDYLKGLPIVRITLAFAPTNTFAADLSNNISNTVGVKTLIDLVIDEYIVGGAIFEFRGKVFRQTLDGALEEVLAREVGGLGR